MKKYLIGAFMLAATAIVSVIFLRGGNPADVAPTTAETTGEIVQTTQQDQLPQQTHTSPVTELPSTIQPLPTMPFTLPAGGLTGGNPAGEEKPDPVTTTTQAPTRIAGPNGPVTSPTTPGNLALAEQVVRAAGFLYDKEQNIFYSDVNPWQKNFGFTSVYDAFAKFGAMIYETERFKFSYGGYDWMFQIWKGRYGITSGAEMGIYYREMGKQVDFYDCADAGKYVAMDFRLYHKGQLYMFRGPERHWWLTGFRLGDIVYGKDFLMVCTYYLDDAAMADALEQAVQRQGFVREKTYIREGNNIQVWW